MVRPPTPAIPAHTALSPLMIAGCRGTLEVPLQRAGSRGTLEVPLQRAGLREKLSTKVGGKMSAHSLL